MVLAAGDDQAPSRRRTMSASEGYEVAAVYTRIDRIAKEMGTRLASPFYDPALYGPAGDSDLKPSNEGVFINRDLRFSTNFWENNYFFVLFYKTVAPSRLDC